VEVFFLGGAFFLEGKRNSRTRGDETFSQDDGSSKQPWVYVIYYMLSSGGFDAACLQDIVKGVLDCPGHTRALFKLRQRVICYRCYMSVICYMSVLCLVLGPS
jgi:hypothetical protein